jgi:hypothetical protein
MELRFQTPARHGHRAFHMQGQLQQLPASWSVYFWLVQPLWKILVSWDDIPSIWKNKNVPNHQPDLYIYLSSASLCIQTDCCRVGVSISNTNLKLPRYLGTRGSQDGWSSDMCMFHGKTWKSHWILGNTLWQFNSLLLKMAQSK